MSDSYISLCILTIGNFYLFPVLVIQGWIWVLIGSVAFTFIYLISFSNNELNTSRGLNFVYFFNNSKIA